MDAKPPIACGVLYSIERGDTLFRIAVRAYGDGWEYKRIFDANRDLLPDEKSVEIGDQVLVPCLDGTGPATRREALVQAAAAEADPAAAQRSEPTGGDGVLEILPIEPLDPIDAPRQGVATLVLAASLDGIAANSPQVHVPQPDDGPGLAEPSAPRPAAGSLPVRLLTGDALPPFTGEQLRQGGLATEIVTRAMGLAAPGQEQRIAHVIHWEVHLEGLLLNGALDVGFPWARPDCGSGTALTSQAQSLCAEFAFSRPFLELSIAVYARADDPVTDLAGRTVCRPQTSYAFDMDTGIPSAAGTIHEETAVACFARLLERDVDAVQLSRREAETALGEAGTGGRVREIEALATTRTLHAVAPRSSPSGLAYLALIDAGLEELMITGEWFRIVTEHQGSRLALAK